MQQPNQHHALTRREQLTYANYLRLLDTVSARIGPVYLPGKPVYVGGAPQSIPGPGHRQWWELLESIGRLDDLAIERCGCFVKCSVESNGGCGYTVSFDDGSSFLLQVDYEQASFADSCGLFDADTPDGHDGIDNPDWPDADLCDIWYCPGYYLDCAETQS